MLAHPPGLPAGKGRIALFSARIFDSKAVKGLRQPFAAANLMHADAAFELFRQLCEYHIALAQQQISRLLGRSEIDAYAAQAHL